MSGTDPDRAGINLRKVRYLHTVLGRIVEGLNQRILARPNDNFEEHDAEALYEHLRDLRDALKAAGSPSYASILQLTQAINDQNWEKYEIVHLHLRLHIAVGELEAILGEATDTPDSPLRSRPVVITKRLLPPRRHDEPTDSGP